MIMASSAKFNMNFPKFNFQEDLRVVAELVIIKILAENINNQETLTEGPLPALEPATIKAKARQGLSPKTLIATGKLIRSFIQRDKGKNSVVVTLRADRMAVGEYLQIEGVGKKKKKFNFFGISSRMEKNAMAYMNSSIKKAVNARGTR